MSSKYITVAALTAFMPFIALAEESVELADIDDAAVVQEEVTPDGTPPFIVEIEVIDAGPDGFAADFEADFETTDVFIMDGGGFYDAAIESGPVPFKCPIEKIRIAYQNLVNPEDTLVALAIEKQTLAICRQSQEALIDIAENEARLTELFEPILMRNIPVIEPVAPVEPAVIDVVDDAVVVDEPVEDIFSIFDEPVDDPLSAILEPAPEEEVSLAPPPYALAAIMKDPIGWKAMLVDGNAIFTVRAGDFMDDGSKVITVEKGKVELLSADDQIFSLEY